MIGRILVSIGIFFTGYYLGKQFGLTEHIRKDLSAKRHQQSLARKTTEKSGAGPEKTATNNTELPSD